MTFIYELDPYWRYNTGCELYTSKLWKLSYYSPRMCALSYAWSIRLRDKAGGHTIRSAISENPMLHAYFMALCFIEPEFCRSKFYIAGIEIFDFLLLWPWPWPDDLHIRTWPVFSRDMPDVQKMNFLSQSFRKLSSDRETDKRNWTLSVPFFIMCDFCLVLFPLCSFFL